VINLGHSACLIYGGSFEPAYILTVTALPSLVQSTTNKRNLALLQSFLNKSLNVPAHRGVVRFIGVAEDSFGTRGTTVLGEIESLSKVPLKGKIEERPKTPKDKKVENALPSDQTATRRRTDDKEMTSKQPRRKSEAATRDRGSQEKSSTCSADANPEEQAGYTSRASAEVGKEEEFSADVWYAVILFIDIYLSLFVGFFYKTRSY
jgi:hypothetical protein